MKSLQEAGIQLWRAVILLEYPRDDNLRLIKDAVVSEETLCFVKKSTKHFPDFVNAFLGALEREDYPTDKEEPLESVENDSIEEEDDIDEEWNPKSVIVIACLHELIQSYPDAVDHYLLPYIKTTIKVSVLYSLGCYLISYFNDYSYILQDKDWRKRFSALYILKRVINVSRENGTAILKPFMPLVRAVTRDRDSMRLRCEALYLIGVMLVIYPKLVPGQKELVLLLNSINECRDDCLQWVNTPTQWFKWRLNFFFAFNSLIHAAYDNAAEVIKHTFLITIHFVISDFFIHRMVYDRKRLLCLHFMMQSWKEHWKPL